MAGLALVSMSWGMESPNIIGCGLEPAIPLWLSLCIGAISAGDSIKMV